MGDGRHKWWRKWFGAAVTLAVLCIVLGGFAWWLLGTTLGARWLIGSALPYARQYLPDTLQLDIEGIEADTIANLRIERLTLADSEGVWFEGRNLRLAWHPAALWGGVLHIGDVSAQRLQYLRPPVEVETEAISPQEHIAGMRDTLQQLPEMLSGETLPPMRLDRLVISELAMDGTTYALSGNADLTQRPVQLSLSVESVEGVETMGKIALNGDARSATLEVQWREAGGGLLGELLALQRSAPLRVEVTSSLDGAVLVADIDSSAGEKALLTGQAKLPLATDAALSAELRLDNPALLHAFADLRHPVDLNATLDDSVLHLALATEEVQMLRHVTLESQLDFADEMRLSATGRAKTGDGKPLELEMQAALDGDTLEISRLLATMPDAAVQATGVLDMQDGDAELEGTLTLPQLDARFEGEGSDLFTAPQGELEVVAEKFKTSLPSPFDRVLTAPLTLKAQTQESGKTWPGIALEVESAHINGEGMISPNAVEEQPVAQATLEITGLPLPLTLAAEYRASGSGHLRAASPTLLAETEYRMKGRFLHLDNLRLEADDAIQLAGKAVVDREALLAEGELNGRIISTKSLSELGLQVPLIAAADGETSLTLAHPGNQQQVALTFSGGKMTLEGKPLADKALLDARVTLPEKTEVQISAATEIDGLQYPVEWDEIRVNAEGPVSRLAWSLNAQKNAPAATLSADGELRLDEAVIVLLNSLKAQWQENRLKLQKPAELSYAPDHIALSRLDLRLNDSASLKASASLGAENAAGDVEIANLPVKSLPFGNTALMEGVVNGKLSFSGAPSNPRAELEMELGGLQQNYPTMAVLHDQELTLTLRGELQEQNVTATFSANAPDSASFAAANASLPVEVSLHPQSLHFTPKGTLDAAIKADLMLAPFLPLFLPDGIYGAGKLVADMTMKGALDAPNLQGTLALDSGRVEVLAAGTVINDIRLRATARGKRITVTEGRATDGGKGALSLKGTFDLTPALPMDMEAGARHFVVLRHNAVIATISGDTTLEGTLAEAVSKGNWQIESAQIAIQPPGESDIPELRVVEVASLDAPVKGTPENGENGKPFTREQRRLERPFSRNLTLDHEVKADNKIFLEGFGLNAELKGDVAITGTAARPKLAGKMETLRGRWEFFGRTFTIARGEARLSEDNLTAPLITISAETEAEDVTAIAQITGTTGNPKIEFSSIPSLPQDEILARVMFGRNLKSISPYQALQLADMLRSLRAGGGGTSINPLSKLQHTLGIDELKINNDSGNGEDMTVGVGKYLKENIYLEVEGGAGQDSGKVSVEVDLTPNISVSTETRQTADSAVRLNYKYDY